MLKHAKVTNETTKTVDVGLGTNVAFYQSIGMALMDVEQGYDGNWYLSGYAPVRPTPTTDELAAILRTERDARITACDWIISRHAEQVALGVETTLTADEYTAWLTYRQELRDMPSADGFPWDGGATDEACPWPVEPLS